MQETGKPKALTLHKHNSCYAIAAHRRLHHFPAFPPLLRASTVSGSLITIEPTSKAFAAVRLQCQPHHILASVGLQTISFVRWPEAEPNYTLYCITSAPSLLAPRVGSEVSL
jgi:hypothetical protein